jgi:hypothetical protein
MSAITVWRFPDGEYERFKQILLLAIGGRSTTFLPTKRSKPSSAGGE